MAFIEASKRKKKLGSLISNNLVASIHQGFLCRPYVTAAGNMHRKLIFCTMPNQVTLRVRT